MSCDLLAQILISEDKLKLFEFIQEKLNIFINPEFILTTKTEKGNTQVKERIIIDKIKTVLNESNIDYKEAGSQQSKDFRNVGNIGLNIEIKKTDNSTIYFNDTCPCGDIYYIIFYTGKKYKRHTKKNIQPQLIYLNGNEFLEDCEWLEDYKRDIETLKDKYGRGENKKLLTGIMEVYPRPTYKANISKFIIS